MKVEAKLEELGLVLPGPSKRLPLGMPVEVEAEVEILGG